MITELENHALNTTETFGVLNKSGGNEPPVDKEPPVPEAKNRAQNPSTGGSGDTGGFFHTEGGAWDSKTLPRSEYSCYHCDYYQTDIETDYLTHGATKHVNKPMFPGKADIERLDLKPQGKSWEV